MHTYASLSCNGASIANGRVAPGATNLEKFRKIVMHKLGDQRIAWCADDCNYSYDVVTCQGWGSFRARPLRPSPKDAFDEQ